MKKLSILLLFVLLGMTACSSDSDSPTEPASGSDPVATGNVGSGGGSVGNDVVILEIPAGALASDTQVKIFLDASEDPFGGETASDLFRLEGLPDNLGKAVTLKLAHGAASPDSLYGMLGGESWVPSLDETIVTWMMADCRDSVGWAIFDFEPAEQTAGKADTSTPILVTTVKGISRTETSDGHFRILWSPRMATTAQITALRDNIEEAMLLYDLMGFEQTDFDAWPVQVLVKPLNWFGHWAPSSRRLGGHLAFSTKYIHDDVEMRLTAGHELLHFCQYFYDPRTVRDRGTKACSYSWLMEATAVYIEDYFAPNPEYCSEARGGRELTALDGLITPAGRSLANHGYGQSSIIRYLAEVEDDDFILKTFADISTGTHAVEALQSQTETDLQDVWRDLLEELVTGKIYSDVTLPVLVNYGPPTILTIGSAADSVGSSGLAYPDLSGQPYFLRWTEGYYFNDNQRLEFWCDASEYGLSIYGVKEPGTRELLGHAYGKVVINNLAAVRENYTVLMALVSNHQLSGPNYSGTTGITLESRLRESENFGRYDHARVRIKYEADWSTSPDNTYGQEMNFTEVWGSFDGTTFTASWDSTNSSGTQRSGHIIVTLDPTTLDVLSWSARNYSLGVNGSSSNFQASGGAVPTDFHNSVYLDAIVEDEETCGSINNLSVTFIDEDGIVTRNLDGYTCNPSSYVKVLMNNRDPD